MKKQTTKIPIYFNELRYNENVKSYEMKTSLEANIDLEVNKLLKSEGIVIKDKTDVINEFFKTIESVNSQKNPMELEGKKLVELYGLQLVNLDVMQKNYLKVKDVKQPKTEDFTIWAETPEEIKRFETATNLTEAINRLKPFFINKFGRVPLFELRKTFNGILDLNDELQALTPNVNFIKND
jgi:hypothetical protein